MSGVIGVVVHEPTLAAPDGVARVAAVVLAAVRAEARRLEGASDDAAGAGDGAVTPP